jgi:hypothetical protein
MTKSAHRSNFYVAFSLLGLAFWLSWDSAPISIQAETGEVGPEQALFQQFEKEIWPLLTRNGGDSCVQCHDAEHKSELHFFPDAKSNFRMLAEKGYFSLDEPDALLGRLTSTHPKKQMPKGQKPERWTEAEIQLLRSLATNLNAHLKIAGHPDEQFPGSLTTPYRGEVPKSLDNQFISFRQLRGKVQTIFQDDWNRNGRDLFQENIALFGGADFKERFNETTKASATFLTGLEMLSRDVSARAYTQKSGPFADRADQPPSPISLSEPDAFYQTEISRLYETILFRSPTPREIRESFALLQSVYRSDSEIRETDYELSFLLTVSDAETGLKAVQTFTLPVRGETRGLYQELIDQSSSGPEEKDPAEADKPANRRNRQVSGQISKHTLAGTFYFQTKDNQQSFRISNLNTVGNVSFHSIELRLKGSLDTNAVQRISVTNALVQAEGAWKVEDRRGLTTLEDENNDKGNSIVTIPISVEREGEYEITVGWRRNVDNASGVLAEVFSHTSSQLVKSPAPPLPPVGEAQYFIDQSEDNIAFADLKAVFQFGEKDFVEINNKGTRNRVTADAVKFISTRDKKAILVDNDEAEGRELWQTYDSGQFRAYNQTGKNTYHDNNTRKGELTLRYLPSLKPDAWQRDTFYSVQVGYPAKRDHETRAPVVVKAQKSSPLIRMAHPARTKAGVITELDASASFTIQRSPLKFAWQQTGGPAVAVADWHAPSIKFAVPRLSVQQAAWQGLCRALMRHPDFLFTRPPSIQAVTKPEERQRLQLVKIAQDLVARPPTAGELEKLSRGAGLAQMIDTYLQSQEFKDFYFHRVRLYLESQGTETQDEPARLWCYVAFNDRPFQEILTADYTVDAKMRRQSRPNYHGKTGVLTTPGFIEGKPGLPHFNYSAQVAELFLGYVFEVPPEVIAQREGITAISTTDPTSLCYSCHKVLTPLALQRNRWDDQGRFRIHDEYGLPIDDTDQKLVSSYPFAGEGLEAFAVQAVKKERFIRTIINTHFTFFFGREMRYLTDERVLYKRLWDGAHRDNFTIQGMIKTLLTSPEYLEGQPVSSAVAGYTTPTTSAERSQEIRQLPGSTFNSQPLPDHE